MTKATENNTAPFAVIAAGGKQYIVRPGTVLTIEKMDGEFTAGQAHTFDQVLLTDDGSKTVVGTPTVAGAKVTAEFIESGRTKKIDIIRYRAKSRYHKKNGHRQPFMRFKVTAI